MKYKIDHDLHIHSHLSVCVGGDMEQCKENILAYGVENGYKYLCLTDHFWDKSIPNGGWKWYDTQNFPHIQKALPLPQAEGTAFYFGGETDLAAGNVLGLSPETMKKMDFIIIPTTHMHFWESGIKHDATASDRAKAWIERFHTVLDMDLPFHKVGIAHLACCLMIPTRETEKVFSLILDEELQEVFTKAAKLGVGIEINASDFDFAKQPKERVEQTLRVFSMAKKCGCKFYLGSDAHHLAELESSRPIFEAAIEYLGLTESDKFYPFKKEING